MFFCNKNHPRKTIFHPNVYHTRYLIELLFVVVSIEKWPDKSSDVTLIFTDAIKTNWKRMKKQKKKQKCRRRKFSPFALLSPMQVSWIPTRMGWTEQLWKHPNEILRLKRKKHLFFISAFHRFSMCLLNLYERSTFLVSFFSSGVDSIYAQQRKIKFVHENLGGRCGL